MTLILKESHSQTVKEAALDDSKNLVACFCRKCGRLCENEVWEETSSGQKLLYTEPKDYVRIIFGTHPKVLMPYVSVPAIFTPIYFCKKCAEETEAESVLIKTILSCDPPSHWIYGHNSRFDAERGYFITAWILDRRKYNQWPFNGQFDRSTFEKIAEKLGSYPGNPFKFYIT
jgi:hypothetical protein